MPATMTQQLNAKQTRENCVTSVEYYSELNVVPTSQSLYTENQPSVSITDWLTPRLLVPPTGQPTNQPTQTTHQRHHLDIQDTIYTTYTQTHI